MRYKMKVDDIRSNEQLKEYIKENGVPGFQFFYGGYYSQWNYSPFTVDGVEYLTAEHWMMVKKALTFNDEESAKEVLNVEHPSDAKKIGRKVKDFDPVKWGEVGFEYVVQGNVYKFEQNNDHLRVLEKDMGFVLVEASPSDNIWGIGVNEFNAPRLTVDEWRGTNLLGYAIMEARTRILLGGY
jgi:ribA/ribD-fused uncharacterized protein